MQFSSKKAHIYPAFVNNIIYIWTIAYCNSDLHEYRDTTRCEHVRNLRIIKPTQSIPELDWAMLRNPPLASP